MFRGISQTNDGPQVQGDVTLSHESGLYAGVWASNTEAGGPGNSVEIDPFVGFAGTIGPSDTAYDVGFWYYSYPGAKADLDYWEIYAIVTQPVGNATIGASIWYADNYFGVDFFPNTSAIAYEALASYALPNGFSISGRIGRQTFDEQLGQSDQDYTYYDIGVAKSWRSLTFDLRWHNAGGVSTDLAAPENVGSLVGSASIAF